MCSKVIFCHPKWQPSGILKTKFDNKKVAYWSKMTRNAIESENDRRQPFSKIKKKIEVFSCILIWNCEKCHQKWPPQFCKKNMKFAYWSKMARNAIESDFRSFKMAAVIHFVNKFSKKLKLRIDMKWREMRTKVIFSHPKMGGHFGKKSNN